MPQSTGAYYTIRAKIITDHLDKFPDAGSHTISKILFRDFPEYFTSIENARQSLRYRRGTKGKKLLSELKDKRYVKIQSS